MRELSIFIDESGDFGCYHKYCPYYIVSLVLHEQNDDINSAVSGLNSALEAIGLKNHTIHTAPLIRREQSYKFEERQFRIKIFNLLYHFIRKVKIQYKTLIAIKKPNYSAIEITDDISKKLAVFLKENSNYFLNFDKIIVYYDNGQIELTKILVSVFNAIIGENIEFRNVSPFDYKLFQAADFICTISLLEQKLLDGKSLSNSEKSFFSTERDLNKKYIKHIKKLEF